MIAVAAVFVWYHWGFGFILFLAGRQDVPQELYEAPHWTGRGGPSSATSPGPACRTVTGIVSVLTLLSGLQIFGTVQVLTNGGPAATPRSPPCTSTNRPSSTTSTAARPPCPSSSGCAWSSWPASSCGSPAGSAEAPTPGRRRDVDREHVFSTPATRGPGDVAGAEAGAEPTTRAGRLPDGWPCTPCWSPARWKRGTGPVGAQRIPAERRSSCTRETDPIPHPFEWGNFATAGTRAASASTCPTASSTRRPRSSDPGHREPGRVRPGPHRVPRPRRRRGPILVIMIIPLPASFIAQYKLLITLGLANTRIGYILVLIAGGLPISILIMRGFFASQPKELEEAAAIDGASLLGTFWRHHPPAGQAGPDRGGRHPGHGGLERVPHGPGAVQRQLADARTTRAHQLRLGGFSATQILLAASLIAVLPIVSSTRSHSATSSAVSAALK